MNHVMQNRIPVVLSILGFVLLWVTLSYMRSDQSILPYPWVVWRVFLSEIQNGELLFHSGHTLRRVLTAFSISMVLGTIIGIVLGKFKTLNSYVNPWVVIFLNIPALVVIVVCYLWIGLNETAAIVAVCINKTAMVIVTIREGAQRFDRALSDMATVFQFGFFKTLRHIMLPQLAPFLLAAVRNGLAVIWKIVLVVEFLGRSNGIGFQIHLYFQLFETDMVLAYALSFVGVMAIIEYVFFRPLERYTTSWSS